MFRDGRYEVTLPWQDNQTVIFKRQLQGLLKKLDHHPEVLQEFDAIIQEKLQDIIEKVGNEGCQTASTP